MGLHHNWPLLIETLRPHPQAAPTGAAKPKRLLADPREAAAAHRRGVGTQKNIVAARSERRRRRHHQIRALGVGEGAVVIQNRDDSAGEGLGRPRQVPGVEESLHQCSGSMTFWCRSGSGSADPCPWLMDPVPGSGSCYFRH